MEVGWLHPHSHHWPRHWDHVPLNWRKDQMLSLSLMCLIHNDLQQISPLDQLKILRDLPEISWTECYNFYMLYLIHWALVILDGFIFQKLFVFFRSPESLNVNMSSSPPSLYNLEIYFKKIMITTYEPYIFLVVKMTNISNKCSLYSSKL